jgi:hypothetical protein
VLATGGLPARFRGRVGAAAPAAVGRLLPTVGGLLVLLAAAADMTTRGVSSKKKATVSEPAEDAAARRPCSAAGRTRTGAKPWVAASRRSSSAPAVFILTRLGIVSLSLCLCVKWEGRGSERVIRGCRVIIRIELLRRQRH